MRARFADMSLFEDIDAVGFHDGGETMCNQNRDHIRMEFGYVYDGIRNFFFYEAIKSRRGLVKNEQLRLSEKRPRDSEALLLTSGKFDSSFSDERINTFRQFTNKFIQRSLLQYRPNIVISRIRFDEQQILFYAS